MQFNEMSFLSSSGRSAQWFRLIFYSSAVFIVLWGIIPMIYSTVPALRHSCEQQDKYDIEAGAIYYTDVPVSLDSEMACRKAVQEAMEKRALSF